jgi:voltage-gated potassium channel
MKEYRKHVFTILEGWGRADLIGRSVDIALIVLITVNVVAVTLESLAGWHSAYGPWFDGLEVVSVAIFTLEYLLRVWAACEDPDIRGSSPLAKRVRYILSPAALIDLAAILPFYLVTFGLIGPVDGRALRAIRMLRVLKLTRYSVAMQSIVAVFHNERRTMVAAMVIVFITLHLSATAIYFVEGQVQPDKFSSIPEAMWWALTTLTTVGYGDVVPVTPWGRVIGAVVMVAGIGIFVLWTGLFASSFVDELRRRDFRVSWQMVAQVPAFAKLDAAHVGEIARLLQPLVVPARHMIVRAGEKAENMYFIVSGEVEVELHPKPHRLGPGEFFGELGLLQGPTRDTTVVALKETRLLVLDSFSFEKLMRRHPDLNEAIRSTAASRQHWTGLLNALASRK